MLQVAEVKKDVVNGGRNLLMAGFGVYVTAEESVKSIFGKLVEKGSKMENKSEGAIQEKTNALRDNMLKVVGKVEDGFSKGMRGVLHRVGVPTREEIHSLSKNVRDLTAKVEKLQPQN